MAFCKAELHEASTLYIPKVTEAFEETALEEALDPRRIGSEDPDLGYLGRLLCLDTERRGEHRPVPARTCAGPSLDDLIRPP
jgi:hypothetical protein